MAQYHQRNAASSEPYSGTAAQSDKDDYRASRVRSREEKDYAALEAQRRAAANRDDVLRETQRATEKAGFNSRNSTSRGGINDRHRTTSAGQNDSSRAHEDISNPVRVGTPPDRQVQSDHATTERVPHQSSKDRSRRSSSQSQRPPGTATSWTSSLKAFAVAGNKDTPARMETHTTTAHQQQQHQQPRRRHSKERARPQDAAPSPIPRSAMNVPQPDYQVGNMRPPQAARQVEYPPVPPPHPPSRLQHFSQSASAQRIDVYLNAGPSDWHVTNGGQNIPIDATAASATHQQAFPPGPNTQPIFPSHCPPPQQVPRNRDFFGPIAMHCLNSVQSGSQHHQQQSHPHHAFQQHHQQPPPQQQPDEHVSPQAPRVPPKVSHEASVGQQSRQQQEQSQPPSSAYPLPKNRMPVWDDQAQKVRWEWR